MRLACPSCQQSLNIPESAAGKKVKCPSCSTVLRVPGEAAAASPVRASAPPPPPPPPRDDEGDYDDPAPKRRRSRDDDYDDAPRRASGRTPAALSSACMWLLIATIGLIAFVFIDLLELFFKINALRVDVNFPGARFNVGPSAGGSLVFWFFLYALFWGPCFPFMFIGYAKGKNLTGRGWFVAALVLSIVLGGIMVIYFIWKLMSLFVLLTFFQIIGFLAAGVVSGLALFAGIRGFIVLGRPEVNEAFGVRTTTE